MTRKELQVEANKKCAELINQGWNYDDARFATIALARKVLGNDNEATEDWQEELQQEFEKLLPVKRARSDFRSPHLPDFDFDTSVNGIE